MGTDFAIYLAPPIANYARTMNNTSLPPQFGPRLQKLDREIQHSLSEVRRHIQELEQAEKNAGNSPAFADLLKASVDEQNTKKSS